MQKRPLIFFFTLFTTLGIAQNKPSKMVMDAPFATELAKTLWKNMGYEYDGFTVYFRENEHQIATYFKRENKIRVKQSVVDQLVNHFGWAADDALAVLLAHELWHKKQGQDSEGFGSEDNDIERAADYYGLLTAHFAGFAAIEIYDKLIATLEVNNLKRKETNDWAAKQLEEQLPLYDLAMYYTLIGDRTSLPLAGDILEKINVELHKNNDIIIKPLCYQRGVVNFLLALEETNFNCVFPLELSKNTFLNPKRGENTVGDKAKINAYLNKANQAFQTILDKEDYFDAQLGVASVAVLRDMLTGETTANSVIDYWLNSHPANMESSYAWQAEQNNLRTEQRKKMKQLKTLKARQATELPSIVTEPTFFLPVLDGIENYEQANFFQNKKVFNRLIVNKLDNSTLSIYGTRYLTYYFQECPKNAINLSLKNLQDTDNAAKISAGSYRYFNYHDTKGYDVIVQLNSTMTDIKKVI
ncbi:MAG: hypothetical protein RLZZ292_2827, partial [Bacteroidota bacterium]